MAGSASRAYGRCATSWIAATRQPATCRSADRRRAALSARIARVGDCFYRVEVRQQLWQAARLLAAMNRRQGLQLAAVHGPEEPVGGGHHLLRGQAGRLRGQRTRTAWKPLGVEANMAIAIAGGSIIVCRTAAAAPPSSTQCDTRRRNPIGLRGILIATTPAPA